MINNSLQGLLEKGVIDAPHAFEVKVCRGSVFAKQLEVAFVEEVVGGPEHDLDFLSLEIGLSLRVEMNRFWYGFEVGKLAWNHPLTLLEAEHFWIVDFVDILLFCSVYCQMSMELLVRKASVHYLILGIHVAIIHQENPHYLPILDVHHSEVQSHHLSLLNVGGFHAQQESQLWSQEHSNQPDFPGFVDDLLNRLFDVALLQCSRLDELQFVVLFVFVHEVEIRRLPGLHWKHELQVLSVVMLEVEDHFPFHHTLLSEGPPIVVFFIESFEVDFEANFFMLRDFNDLLLLFGVCEAKAPLQLHHASNLCIQRVFDDDFPIFLMNRIVGKDVRGGELFP